MDTIDTMRAFLAVAQEGSFTAAGKRLGLSTRLVSKYVAQLESKLATQLFNRTTRSVALTDVGLAYLERCRPIVEQLDELEDLVQERQSALAGLIRITAPTGFGSNNLARALAPFLQAHQNVDIDLKLSDARVALVEDGIDMAIRIGVLRDSTLIARKLADMPLIVCASPDYLAAHGRPRDPAALATHNCLIDENPADATAWRFLSGAREFVVKVSGAFHANAPAAIANMAIAGVGIGRCPYYAVAHSLENGSLEQLFPDYDTEKFGLYALYPPNRHLTARVRALIDHLAKHFTSGSSPTGPQTRRS
ncbi:LysR family transcriptional regulator [Ruegeria halocynthiae]|uniref:LysR family transcriptional regulator n=1 Tax=Ruegeria halocynthiae TaxID=985054 RepID=UPI00068F3869|nr:LysR family transcriptional regulator [Ruegeria halocynthiae]